jgi:hypothetical protein
VGNGTLRTPPHINDCDQPLVLEEYRTMKSFKRAIAALVGGTTPEPVKAPALGGPSVRGKVFYSDTVLIQILEASGKMGYYYLDEETVFTDGLLLEDLDDQEVRLHLDPSGYISTISTSLTDVEDILPDPVLDAEVTEVLDHAEEEAITEAEVEVESEAAHEDAYEDEAPAVTLAEDDTETLDEAATDDEAPVYVGKHALLTPTTVVSSTHFVPPTPSTPAVEFVETDETVGNATAGADESLSIT